MRFSRSLQPCNLRKFNKDLYFSVAIYSLPSQYTVLNALTTAFSWRAMEFTTALSKLLAILTSLRAFWWSWLSTWRVSVEVLKLVQPEVKGFALLDSMQIEHNIPFVLSYRNHLYFSNQIDWKFLLAALAFGSTKGSRSSVSLNFIYLRQRCQICRIPFAVCVLLFCFLDQRMIIFFSALTWQ